MAETGNILIVDDNPNNLEVLLGLLAPVGYKVRPALSGEIALKAVEASPPDLILLDVRMPGLDGFETCRRLKACDSSKDIPVIFISAMQEMEDKVSGFSAGGVDYIAKPFQSEEVLMRVKTHIDLFKIKRHLEDMVAQRTAEVTRSEACYRVLFEDSPLGIAVFSTPSLVFLQINEAFTRLLGYTYEELKDKTLEILEQGTNWLPAFSSQLSTHSEEPAFTGPLKIQHKDGQVVEIEGVLQRINYPGQPAQLLMLQDVTENRKMEERLRQTTKEHHQQLKKLELFDQLTGLPNRTLLSERIQQSLDQAAKTESWLTVCYLDIDNFKPINDLHGKVVGDKLLANVADCLTHSLRGGDSLSRIGGDEFAFLLLGLKNKAEIIKLLDKIQAELAQPFVSDDMNVCLSASIGVAIFPEDEGDPDTLLRHANQAMLEAKKSGKNSYAFFDLESEKRQISQHAIIESMRNALNNREFVLYYQPKVNIATKKVFGAEALIRWQHPEKGLLPPGAFLPAIEGDEFMVKLGEWVIDEALRQMVAWQQLGIDLSVSVNVAAEQLEKPDFMASLEEKLRHHESLQKQSLELEVLETSTLGDVEKVEQLIQKCRELGVGFSLDDFGTGYSSLSYLRNLSADTLKIDQSFIRFMMENPGDRAIVAGVIGLANAFQRSVIAEGVETIAHGKFLLGLGCVKFQGYGIARPMPPRDIPEWIGTWPNKEWRSIIESHNQQ